MPCAAALSGDGDLSAGGHGEWGAHKISYLENS